MEAKFLTLKQVSVQVGGRLALDKIDWTIHKGEQWAITGPSGSGKSVLAHTIQGRHFASGLIDWHQDHAPRIAVVDQQHKFKNRSGTTDLYYQQRFNSSDAEQTITVAQELAEHNAQSSTDIPAELTGWLDHLHIRQLLDRPLIQLSNGENKRVQLAIALLDRPDLLILDNPFLGLDVEGRKVLTDIINMLAKRGMELILVIGTGELPGAITHVLRLEDGKTAFTGSKQLYISENTEEATLKLTLDNTILEELRQMAEADKGAPFDTAVKMVDVSVNYDGKYLLQDINWTVQAGSKWNVSGPNGAGKSTILSLITADNPQAYANEIYLFDRRRGSGETIWEIKKNIGFVSPELHLYFENSATCFDVIASGLFDTIGLFRPLNEAQSALVMRWMKLLSLTDMRSRRLSQLSTGQQRMVLLARALIKNPPMLILDEPCQGLDDKQIAYFRQLVNILCTTFGKTLIYVSHYSQELPDCIDQFLRLDNGRQVS